MENSFKSIISSAGSITIFLPENPTLDQTASALTFFLAIKDVKPASIVSAVPVQVAMNRLIGIDKISNEAGNKNLVVGFSNYDANGIERVSYDIVDNQFKLTVIPKSGVVAPRKEQVLISYEGVMSDTIIFFGGTTDNDFPQLKSKGYDTAKMYHIGTSPLTVDPSRVVYTYAQPMSSVSELTFFLLNEAQLPINADSATNLLMGIEDATQSYKTGNITAETFEVTGALMRLGGKRNAGQGVSADSFPKGAIPQIPNMPIKPIEPVSVLEEEDAISTPTDFADFTGEMSKSKDVNKTSVPSPMTAEAQQVKEDVDDVLNPPDEWLQPKVFRGTSLN